MEENSSSLPCCEKFENASSVPTESDASHQTVNTTYQLVEMVFFSVNALMSLVGNGLSLAVFTRSRLRGTPSSGYLAALAVADAGCATIAVFWIYAEMFDYLPSVALCHIFPFLNDVFLCFSAWFVVCTTAERYISVCHPLHAPRIMSRLRERRVLSVVILLLSGSYAFHLVPERKKLFVAFKWTCTDSDNELAMKWEQAFIYVTYALSFVLPALLIVVLNVIITCTLRGIQGSSHLSARVKEERRAQSSSISRKLFLVSLFFFVCNFPVNTLTVLFMLRVPVSLWIQLPCLILFNLNFSCNVFLYALSGSKFRSSLGELFPFRCSKREASSRASNGNSTDGSVCDVELCISLNVH